MRERSGNTIYLFNLKLRLKLEKQQGKAKIETENRKFTILSSFPAHNNFLTSVLSLSSRPFRELGRSMCVVCGETEEKCGQAEREEGRERKGSACAAFTLSTLLLCQLTP